MENILLILIQRFSASLSSRTIFIIYYSFIIVLVHLYHGLWLPIKYLMVSRAEYYQLWADREEKSPEKAVSRMTLEPRRDWPAGDRLALVRGTSVVSRDQHLWVSIGSQSTSTACITRVEI